MISVIKHTGGQRRSQYLAAGILFSFAAGSVFAQGEAASGEKKIEEVVVVGTQIKGAKISDALSVSVVSSADIEALGASSGAELLDFIAEQGSNFFSESENISGGVNSARGDVGAYNLRNLGTGNTLVLLNGRRVVNMAAYQTELVGGSFVPVNSANSQALPNAALERVEILRDGASAIYGADAVAGVVNYVTKTDFEGLTITARYTDFDIIPRNDETLTIEWGNNFNDGRSNVSAFFNYYHRDPVFASDDPRWADSDFRRRLPANSPWASTTTFRNNSADSEYGQYDVIPSVSSMGLTGTIWDSAGEFETYPAGDPRCQWDLGYGTCGGVDGQGTYRYNNNENRDLYSDLDRYNAFIFLNHSFENGMESFTELGWYASRTQTYRHASVVLSAVQDPIVAADNYYNPFGPCTSPNRLPASVIGTGVPCTGVPLSMDNYRWAQYPRIVDNDGDDYRILTGLRGTLGDWDWEGAVIWAQANKDDVTHNRISNTLLDEALADTTSAAFNPFGGRENTNIERALIDVYRKNQTELTSVDFKVSTNDLFELPAGPVGLLAGAEFRTESFYDDRDPRLDGTIVYTDNAGATFPEVSDVMNSSPTSDSKGDRDVTSVFTELQVPVFSNLDLQLAVRYEDYSDVGDTTVGKAAFGWRIAETVLMRGSWSQAFRVPNLITVNEGDFARSNTNQDYVCFYVDPNEDVFDCDYGMQRTAGGNDELEPEKSDNTSIGLVLDFTPNLTLTIDWWGIEKDDTIGLFGEENHTGLDLLRLIEAGTSNCANVQGNPQVVREGTGGLSPDEIALFTAAGICPVGDVIRVDDVYLNLDTRKIRGHDFGVYYNRDTSIGTFDFRYVAAFLDEYSQIPTGPAQQLIDAQESGVLPASVNIEGFANLARRDGNPREKQTMRLSWRKGDWGASIVGTYVSDFIDHGITLDDGTKYVVDSMQTFNTSLDYRFNAFSDVNARARLGVVNVFNERAPLADDSFGYFADVHSDLPRSYYLELRLDF